MISIEAHGCCSRVEAKHTYVLVVQRGWWSAVGLMTKHQHFVIVRTRDYAPWIETLDQNHRTNEQVKSLNTHQELISWSYLSTPKWLHPPQPLSRDLFILEFSAPEQCQVNSQPRTRTTAVFNHTASRIKLSPYH